MCCCSASNHPLCDLKEGICTNRQEMIYDRTDLICEPSEAII